MSSCACPAPAIYNALQHAKTRVSCTKRAITASNQHAHIGVHKIKFLVQKIWQRKNGWPRPTGVMPRTSPASYSSTHHLRNGQTTDCCRTHRAVTQWPSVVYSLLLHLLVLCSVFASVVVPLPHDACNHNQSNKHFHFILIFIILFLFFLVYLLLSVTISSVVVVVGFFSRQVWEALHHASLQVFVRHNENWLLVSAGQHDLFVCSNIQLRFVRKWKIVAFCDFIVAKFSYSATTNSFILIQIFPPY